MPQSPCEGLDEETNATLAADPSPNVRAGLAAHTDAPAVLATLLTDPDPRVRARATENPRTTLDQCRLLANDRLAVVRASAVQSDRLPLDELHRLAHDRSIHVRWWLATSSTTPDAVLRVLAEDPRLDVADQALANLASRGTP
ncbi:hypothetical protein HCN51_20935 [Nonomuraea sp. FMUSA5-5]|uniref:HEAT repeat domain-containing protein n=1 Tax=Nonomuraea composti TaxID=2720023 RepID=A0ABX1B5T7_9ACTN|nr:HEAT repeat domain-containing protein [Nonomuraea sp. FMUSA5-5]NJP91895.1 hypothetical protein [Nonomuraea sp. FMUSA5-5]